MRDRLPSGWRKVVIAVSGGSVILLGVIAIPAPGPGWLIIFAGLSILSKEFAWAGRVLGRGQDEYKKWEAWLKGQNSFVKGLLSIGAVLIFVLLLWLWNLLYIAAGLIGLQPEWLQSPLLI